MSHVAKIKLQLKNLKALEVAATACGLELVKQSKYRWWGHSVGDFPLPEGFTASDLGKCEYALRVKGNPNAYEIGVVRSKTRPGEYELLYDFYGTAGQAMAKQVGGNDGNKLRQEYASAVATAQLRKQGMRVTRHVTADGRVVLRGTA